jgi:GT2 family glycosyltransferase
MGRSSAGVNAPMGEGMQSVRGDGVKPLVSVITTLTFPRRRPVDCLRSWTSGQRFDGDIELVVVSDGRRPRLERRVRAALLPGDRLLRLGREDEMAQYDLGARVARGDWLLFTEPHVEALPDCLAELLEHVHRNDLAGACVRTLPQRDRSRVGRMEARMYQQEAAGWTRDGDWRTFTKRGVLVARAAYLDAGGLDPARQRFAETALAQRLRDLGHRVGYAPRAEIRHQNSTNLRELLAYVWEYRRQDQADADVAGSAGGCVDVAGARVAPVVIRDALRIALARGRDPAWRALVAPLLRLGPALVFRAAAGRWAAAWSPAMRCVAALVRFHRPLQEDERSYAAYNDLWRAVGDLAVATRARTASVWGFHEPESFHGTPFRWTGPIAALWVEGPGPVVLDMLEVRDIGPDDVLVYRGDVRLTPVARASSASRVVFNCVGDGRGPVTLVCPPLLGGDGRDPRSLGLPLVAVHAGGQRVPCGVAGSPI